MLLFWVKISEGKEVKLATRMYWSMFKLQNQGIYSFKWIQKIKSILESTRYLNIWAIQELYDTKGSIMKNIIQTLFENNVSEWYTKVETGSRCTNYKIFKQNLELEFYLTKLNPCQRINMSKFRCGYNNLPVNKYRFQGNEYDKMCKLCNFGEMGDEFHYLFQCKYFKRERKLYIKRYFRTRPSTYKMKELLNTRNNKTLRNFAKFQGLILSKF